MAGSQQEISVDSHQQPNNKQTDRESNRWLIQTIQRIIGTMAKRILIGILISLALLGAGLTLTRQGIAFAAGRGLVQMPQYGWYICEDLGMGFVPGMPEERQMFILCHNQGYQVMAYCLDPGYPPPNNGRHCSMLSQDVFWCGDDVQELRIIEQQQTPTDPPFEPDTPTPTPSRTVTLTATRMLTTTPGNTYTPTFTRTSTVTATPTVTNTLVPDPTRTGTFTSTPLPRQTDPVETPTSTQTDPPPTQTLEDPPMTLTITSTRPWAGGGNTQNPALVYTLTGGTFLLLALMGMFLLLRQDHPA